MIGEALSQLALISFFAVCLLFSLVVFLAPTYIAFRRDHPNRWAIMAVNVFLGGTGIGWGVALVWALNVVHLTRDLIGSNGGESGLNIFANDIRRVRVEPEPERRAHKAEASPLSASEALQKIESLEQLRAAGHIDETEFAALKAGILRQI
jgi:hypothetical protein